MDTDLPYADSPSNHLSETAGTTAAFLVILYVVIVAALITGGAFGLLARGVLAGVRAAGGICAAFSI